MKRFRFLFVVTLLISVVCILSYCGNDGGKKNNSDSVTKLLYLNHSDSAHYVGMQVCRKCHENIFETFIHTGMGQSFDLATLHKSSAKFGKESTIYDKSRDLWYHSYFQDSVMFICEFRLKGKDTTYKRTEKVNYIVGSGQHTNSHMYNVNGYIFQMPMTFYTQKGQWDLPPGFENGFNSRFSRQIGLECMSCHNSLPGFVKGSENKFDSIPNGIGCERCHGPGSIHVAMKESGNIVDTSKYIDYSIVNPGKLSPDLQFDVCQRCHLQGNAVLHDGKSFYDFRPGMKLSDYITVFMPEYAGEENQFIMASHAERLKMSQCFLQTEKENNSLNTDALHPYKNSLTCVTCHNPHVSVRETADEHFNQVCMNCHYEQQPGKPIHKTCPMVKDPSVDDKNSNCVSCHMPRSGAIDIPHVSVHDHYIRKNYASNDTSAVKGKFLGLYAVNDKHPSNGIIAKAYLQQYEKFGKENIFLDSAEKFLPENSITDLRKNFSDLVHLYYLREDFQEIKNITDKAGRKFVLDSILLTPSFDNGDAWTAYRVGEAFFKLGDYPSAEVFYKKAVDLAPYHPDFRSKYALSLATQQKNFDARAQYQQVINEDPEFVPALTNLGYLWLEEGDDKKAESFYKQALALDPDDEQALVNMAGLFAYRKNFAEANKYAKLCLEKHPGNKQAALLIEQLKEIN
ncbi:MAG: tetratricopeptide repeat protein [Bacteroidetes bacterium]|nr:tetratricopeptide repeat protein [Bacteroidota bacterium]